MLRSKNNTFVEVTVRRYTLFAALVGLMLLAVVVPHAVRATEEPAPVTAGAPRAGGADAAPQAPQSSGASPWVTGGQAAPAEVAQPTPSVAPTAEIAVAEAQQPAAAIEALQQATPAPQPTQTPAPQPTPTEPPKPACQGLAAEPINAYVTDRCLNADNRYRTIFSLSGYDPEEDLGIWLVDADGSIEVTDPIGRDRRSRCLLTGTTVTLNTVARCRAMVVNQYGNASGVVFDATDLYPGVWMLVFQSTDDEDNVSVLYFEVLPRPLVRDDPCLSVPRDEHVTVIADCQPVGNLFKLISTGHAANESVGYYITGPDRIVEPLLSYYQPRRADANGTALVIAQLPDTALRGDYYVTVVSGNSQREVVGTIRAR
jgi:hypothetical protein